MLSVVLYQPEIPQNTGNVGRTCVAIGAELWLVRPLGFRLDSHHLRRAGLDYWQHLDYRVVNDWAEAEDSLRGRNCWYFSKTGAVTYTDVRYRESDVLVFGSETQGLPQSLLQHESGRVLRIPTRSQVRSLNLANAVAVAVYEAKRQIESRNPE